MLPFKQRVIEIVRLIPYGKVVSYGQVALYLGLPRSAREVGWVLNSTEGKVDLPWWRVINRNGFITIKGTRFNTPVVQKRLLEAEGIEVSEKYQVDMKTIRFIADEGLLKKWQLSDEYIQGVIGKLSLNLSE